jgi:hypothetical protein
MVEGVQGSLARRPDDDDVSGAEIAHLQHDVVVGLGRLVPVEADEDAVVFAFCEELHGTIFPAGDERRVKPA